MNFRNKLVIIAVACLMVPGSLALAQTVTDPNDASLIDDSPDDITPPANVSNFVATGMDKQVSLSWVNPTDSDFVRTLIVRKIGSAAASTTDGTVVYEGVNSSFIDTELTNNTTYYYTAYAFDNVPNYSTGSTVSVSPQAGKTQLDVPRATGTLAMLPIPGSAGVKLVNDNGTFYLVQNGRKYGIANQGLLYSYGLEFRDAQPAQTADASLPAGSLLPPGNGSLVKSAEDPTVYFISNGQRYSFTSSRVFTALGFKFGSVLVVTNTELQALPKAWELADATAAHLPGTDINDHGTVYWIDGKGRRQPYPSQGVYNSWHKDNDFSGVVAANAADLQLPVGEQVSARVIQ